LISSQEYGNSILRRKRNEEKLKKRLVLPGVHADPQNTANISACRFSPLSSGHGTSPVHTAQ